MRQIAGSLLEEYGLTPADLDIHGLFQGAQQIRAKVWDRLLNWISKRDTRMLGDLVSCGRHIGGGIGAGTTLCQVHRGNLPDKYASGITWLRHLAANAIVAEMTDILLERHKAEISHKEEVRLDLLQNQYDPNLYDEPWTDDHPDRLFPTH